ncbi:MAG: MFS transporter [Pseudomonadales bacterium]
MNSLERRAVASIAALYGLRMLGLFMVLPVLSLYAADYAFSTPALIGFAIGSYGLMQALLQLPLGYLSDRIGRKQIIIAGLLLFSAGSLLAGSADNIYQLIAGRCLQGSGAIASALMALLSDLTRDEQRTKAMAMVGGSIGLSFAVALVAGPIVTAAYGLAGLFYLTAAMAAFGILLVVFVVPAPPGNVASHTISLRESFAYSAREPQLMRLNLSAFILHFILTASFFVIPHLLLEQLDMAVKDHWKVYFGVLLGSLLLMLPAILYGEKRQRTKQVMQAAVIILVLVELGLAAGLQSSVALLLLVLMFFAAFNLLEANLPSQISKRTQPAMKGAAMGLFASFQFSGAFVGGWSSGYMYGEFGQTGVYLLCAGLALSWLLVLNQWQATPVGMPGANIASRKAEI